MGVHDEYLRLAVCFDLKTWRSSAFCDQGIVGNAGFVLYLSGGEETEKTFSGISAVAGASNCRVTAEIPVRGIGLFSGVRRSHFGDCIGSFRHICRLFLPAVTVGCHIPAGGISRGCACLFCIGIGGGSAAAFGNDSSGRQNQHNGEKANQRPAALVITSAHDARPPVFSSDSTFCMISAVLVFPGRL